MTEEVQKVKKRKRSSSKKPHSRKRVAFEADPEIEIALHNESQWVPVIVSVPGINIDTSITFTPYLRNRTKTRKEKPSILTEELLLHSSDHPKLDYKVKEEDMGGPNALLKHYVGIYDPTTGKLDITAARNMVARGIVRAHQYDEENEIISTNLRDQRNILGQTFGTKKARKAIASITENAIQPIKDSQGNREQSLVSSATAAMLSNVAEATKDMTSRNDLAKAADDVKPRPKANESATSIQDIYTADSLIGLDILMKVPVKEWQDKAKAQEEIFVRSRFVASRIQNNINNLQKLRILRFMLMLLDIYQKSKPSREGKKLPKRERLKEIVGDMPEVVLGAAKRKYCENGVINKYHGDLLITHLCAMSLLVDDFETDTCDLKEDLHLDLSQITKYFSEIGVKSVALGKAGVARYGKVIASQRRMAKLKLPLVFPILSFGGKRK